VLLFQKRFHAGLVDGSVTITFRSWASPRVRAGGRYRCHPIGVLEVDRVERVRLGAISEEDARRAGFLSREALLDYVQTVRDTPLSDEDEVFRVELHFGGDGDRVPQALEAALTDDDVEDLRERLARMDKRAEDGPWTFATLELIRDNPRVAASQLAKRVGRERLPFKVDVRKLKRLGLTQSFEVGYELSPRGRAFLERCPAPISRGAKRGGSASPTGSQRRSAGRPSPGRGTPAGGARGGTRRGGSGKAGAASRGRR
jgi:hypothetical protein